MKKNISSFKKRYANDPGRVKELEDEYASTLAVEKKEMEEARKKQDEEDRKAEEEKARKAAERKKKK